MYQHSRYRRAKNQLAGESHPSSSPSPRTPAHLALAAHQEEQSRWLGRSRSSEPHASAYDDDDDVSEDALARLADSFHVRQVMSLLLLFSRASGLVKM